MKILQVNNNHRIIGGSDSVFFNTLDLLDKSEHNVVPFAASGVGDAPSEFEKYFPEGVVSDKARLQDFPRYIYNRDARSKIASLLNAEGTFDIAHLHIYYGRLTTSIPRELKRRGIPIVQTLHEYKLACPVYKMERNGQVCEDCVTGSAVNVLRHRCKGGSLLGSAAVLAEHYLSRLLGDVRLIDRFICVSEFQLVLMARAGIPESKLVKLHNFVDTNEFRPVDKDQKENYLLYYGRIEELKGIPTLITAVKQAGMKLKIAGAGRWVDEMQRAIADDGNIEFLGFVSGAPLRELVARAKAVVVPSEWYENCPMAVLEAKATGTPVIGARIGGIPELIQDGTDGFLFIPADVDGLVEAFDRLQASNISDLGHAAHEDVQAHFSPEAHLQKLLSIYENVR